MGKSSAPVMPSDRKIGGHVGMCETGEGAAVRLGHQRVELGKTLDVHLVEDGPLPRHFGLRDAPGESRVDNAAFLHQGRAVALVERKSLSAWSS